MMATIILEVGVFKGKSQDYQQDTHPVLKSIPPPETKLNKTESQTKMATIILKEPSMGSHRTANKIHTLY